MPVSTASAPVNTRTCQSMCASSKRGVSEGRTALSRLSPSLAKANPSNPPNDACITLSVRSCRIIRCRPAPSAVRMLISLSRIAARESARLATFEHAIINTSATAPRRISNRVRTSATIPFWSGTALALAFQAAGIGHGNRAPTCD